MEILPENPGKCCIGNTSHMAAFPTGLFGYIEIPLATVRPLHYRVKHINTPIHTVIHTYHPDITEPVLDHYQDMTYNTANFELNQTELLNNSNIQSIPLIPNVQPSDKLARRTFPTPPYLNDNLQFLKKKFFSNMLTLLMQNIFNF